MVLTLIYFSYYLPILGHKKDYISQFAGESFAFLMRKIPVNELTSYIESILEQVEQNPTEEFQYGVAHLLFQIVKGVKERFHSKTPSVLKVLFKSLNNSSDSTKLEIRSNVLFECISLMCEHTTNEFSNDIWDILFDQSNSLLNISEKSTLRYDILSQLLKMLSHCIEYQDGSLIQDKSKLWTLAISLSKKEYLSKCSTEFFKYYLNYLSNLVSQSDLQIRLSHLPKLLPLLFSIQNNSINPSLLVQLCDNLLEFEEIHNILIPQYFSYLGKICTSFPNATLEFIYFTLHKRMSELKSAIPINKEIQSSIENILSNYSKKTTSNSIVWMALQISKLMKINSKSILTSLSKIVKQLESNIENEQDILVYSSAMKYQLDSMKDNELQALQPKLFKILSENSNNITILELYSSYIQRIKQISSLSKTVCSLKEFIKMATLLSKNFIEPISNIRETTLKLLLEYEQPVVIIKLEKHNKEMNLFEHLLSIEECEKSVRTTRQITIFLDQLEPLTSFSELEEYQIDAILYYLLGLYFVKFSAAWPLVQKTLAVFARKYASKFSTIFYAQLDRIRNDLSSTSTPNSEETMGEQQFDLELLCEEETIKDEDVVQYLSTEFNSVIQALHDDKQCTDLGTYYNLLVKTLVPLGKEFEPQSLHLLETCLSLYGSDQQQSMKLSKQHRNDILTSFLTVFSKFTRGQKLPKSAEMINFFLELLTKPHESVQLLALQGLCSWNVEYVKPFRENLSLFIKEATLRDQLVNFQIDSIKEPFTKPFVQVLLRVLYSKMLVKGRGVQTDRRSTIINFLLQIPVEYLDYFFGLMSESFQEATSQFQVNDATFTCPSQVLNVSYKRIAGFLHLLEDICSKIKNLPKNIVHNLLSILVYVLWAMYQPVDDSIITKNNASELRGITLKRISQIFSIYNTNILYYKNWSKLIFTILEVPISKLSTEYIHQMSGLLELILTFSSSKDLVVELKETTIIHSVLSMIGSSAIAKSVLRAALQFVDNVVSKDVELKEVKQELLISQSLIDQLLDNFHAYLSRLSQKKDDTIVIFLDVISRLSKLYSIQPTQANKLVDLIVPFLKDKNIDESLKKTLLECASTFMEFVSSKEQLIASLSRLFYLYYKRDSRILLSKVFVQCANYLKINNIPFWASKIADLNKYSTTRIDEYDFNVRLSNFAEIEKNLTSVDKLLYQSLLYNYMFYLRDPDMSIRNSATHGIHKFIEFIKDQPDQSSLLQNLLLPALKKNIVSTHESYIRQELLALLSNLLSSFPNIHPDLHSLVISSPEDTFDFFKGISDIQIHKRIRALLKLQKLTETEKFTQNSVMKLFLPLFTSMIDLESDPSLLHELSKTIGLLTKSMNWSSYYRTLKRYLMLLDKAEKKDRIILKVICEITEQFHFTGADSEDNNKEKIEGIVCKEIIPDLKKHLKDRKTGQVVRINVATAIIKLIKQLPQEIQEEQLPAIITLLCTSLQSKEQSERDSTRQTLLSVATFLGPNYFYFILQELKGCLTRGYQEHVLGYTVHYLLSGMISTLKVGDLDYCLDTILEILLEDNMGEVASKKEVEKVANSMKETKSQTSYDSFQLLAQILRFPESFKILVDTFHTVLTNAESTKVRSRVERILQQITLGLKSNTSVTQENVLIFIHNITQTYLDISTKKAIKETPVTPPDNKKAKNYNSLLLTNVATKQKSYIVVNSFVLVDFGLQLLNHYLKKRGFFDIRSRVTDEMLDPFIPLLVKCMQSNSTSTAILSMKCFSVLLHMDLPSSSSYLDKIKNRLFDLVQGSGQDATKQCFKLISVLLHKYSDVQIEDKQLNAIVHLIDNELETSKQTATFSLLKSILYRKYVCPEIYDLMTRVSFFIVKSEVPHIRLQCRELFTQFLLHYPLGGHRLQQHLDFLVNNLGYAAVHGRESVLQVLLTILQKFPQEVINTKAEYLFLPLVVRLVNEDTESCKKLIGEVTKALLGAIDDSRLDSIWNLMNTWFANQQENEQLYMASIQVLLLLLEVQPNLVLARIDPLLPSFLERIENYNILSESEANNDWQLTYLTLTIIEKMFNIKPSLLNQDLFSSLWNKITEFLDSNHAWIRTVTSRIIGVWFSNIDAESFYENQTWITDSTQLTALTKSLLHQLNIERISDSLAEQTMKNLVYIAKVNHHNPTSVGENERTPQHYLFYRLGKLSTKLIDSRRVYLS